jgi:hypothetical protein
MQISLDIVDLLQLQEIWSRRPIITAFTRLEPRPAAIPAALVFNVDELMPRLARLKRSPVWMAQDARPNSDPARLPLSNFSDDYLSELYPEVASPTEQRQSMFIAAYSRFVVAHYRGSIEQTGALLRSLANSRDIQLSDCLNPASMPLEGSPEWIPAEITDEVRSLDQRYTPAEPGTPAAYVIHDDFWTLLVKVSPEEIEQAIRQHCNGLPDCTEASRHHLTTLAELAYTWQRSPSVVGLCYELAD